MNSGLTDVALVALFAFLGSAVVAITSAMATVFGPAWTGRLQRRAEQETTATDLRYERALRFIEALAIIDGLQPIVQTDPMLEAARDAHVRLAAFVATLRSGEGPIGYWLKSVLDTVERGGASNRLVSDEAAVKVFGWLRGDVPLAYFADPYVVLEAGSSGTTIVN